jgi:hypothetical protein
MYLFTGLNTRVLGEHREYPIESIAPTALHLLGLPVPRSMDGPVCVSVLDQAFLAANPVQVVDDEPDVEEGRGSGWRSSEDETKIREHLQALGYLEEG